MLRHVLCVGDEPETGGYIEPLTSAAPSTIMGNPVAFIGGKAFCNVCKTFGLISKSGGLHRNTNCGREIALDGDVLNCQCPTKPRIVAKTQRIARHEDHADGSGVSAFATPNSAADTTAVRFDEQVQLALVDSFDGYPFAIEMADGRTFNGRIGADGQLPRMLTGERAEDYIIHWGDEALAIVNED